MRACRENIDIEVDNIGDDRPRTVGMMNDSELIQAPHPLAYIRWLMALDAVLGYEDTAMVLAELLIDVEHGLLTADGVRAKYRQKYRQMYHEDPPGFQGLTRGRRKEATSRCTTRYRRR